MLKCGITTDNRCLGHNTGVGHPERSDRIRFCLTSVQILKNSLIPGMRCPLLECTYISGRTAALILGSLELLIGWPIPY